MRTITAFDLGKEDATVTGVYYLGTEDEARYVAALLTAAHGVPLEDIERLGEGGIARVLREREGLRTALALFIEAANSAVAGIPDRSPVKAAIVDARNKARALLAEEA